MTDLNKIPTNKVSLQQARQKTLSVAPSAPASAQNKNARRNSGRTQVTAQEREQKIARLAYLHAEQRGFAPGGEVEDWLRAEAEVDRSAK